MTAPGVQDDAARSVVLLAEDDPAVAMLVQASLHEHVVVHAEDGAEALEVLAERHVDLVLTDVNMPRVDGAALLREVVERPSPPPVLVLTSHADLESRVRLLRLGAADVMRKPFAVEELRARVDNMLAAVRLARTLAIRNQELDRYASHVAHDLRGPLAVVNGFAGVVGRHPGLPDDLQDPVARIRSASRRADDLVRSLLDDASRGPTERVALDELVADVADRVRAGRPALQVDVGPMPEVVGRVASLRQLFRNLLGNAATYHAEGVPPTVVVRGRDAGDGELRIEVADRGVGVPPAERDAVLREGQRGSSGEGHAGSGLGLSAARAVAEAHGGRLWLEDGPDGPDGPGVTVVVQLPLAAEGADGA